VRNAAVAGGAAGGVGGAETDLRRPEKKREPAQPATRRVLSMELQVGDRFSDETGEWEVVGQPYTSAANDHDLCGCGHPVISGLNVVV
jgi:hypothetical protein